MTKKLVATFVAFAALALPLASSAPASAAANTSARLEASTGASAGIAFAPHEQKCVRFNAPGSRTVKVGETRQVHIRLSEACLGSRVSFNGEKAIRPKLRHMLYSTTVYIPGKYTLTFSVIPPKGEGKPYFKAVTYLVVK